METYTLPCPRCDGTGMAGMCDACDGEGYVDDAVALRKALARETAAREAAEALVTQRDAEINALLFAIDEARTAPLVQAVADVSGWYACTVCRGLGQDTWFNVNHGDGCPIAILRKARLIHANGRKAALSAGRAQTGGEGELHDAIVRARMGGKSDAEFIAGLEADNDAE